MKTLLTTAKFNYPWEAPHKVSKKYLPVFNRILNDEITAQYSDSEWFAT